jgi:hypothetical protein
MRQIFVEKLKVKLINRANLQLDRLGRRNWIRLCVMSAVQLVCHGPHTGYGNVLIIVETVIVSGYQLSSQFPSETTFSLGLFNYRNNYYGNKITFSFKI